MEKGAELLMKAVRDYLTKEAESVGVQQWTPHTKAKKQLIKRRFDEQNKILDEQNRMLERLTELMGK